MTGGRIDVSVRVAVGRWMRMRREVGSKSGEWGVLRAFRSEFRVVWAEARRRDYWG